MWAQAARFLDRLFAPLFDLMSPLHAVWQGVLLGLPVAVLALLVYRAVSNQSEIRRTKDALKANLLALRLFRDDLRVVMRSQGRIFLLVGRYLRLGLVPLLVLLVPVVLLIAQIEARLTYRAVAVDSQVHLTLALDDSLVATDVDAAIIAPASVRLETPSFRSSSPPSIMWRLRPVKSGQHSLSIRVGGRTLKHGIWAGDARPDQLVPATYRSGDIRAVAGSGESIGDQKPGIASVVVDYPAGAGMFAGLSITSWAMVISSIIGGLVLRRPFGVEF